MQAYDTLWINIEVISRESLMRKEKMLLLILYTILSRGVTRVLLGSSQIQVVVLMFAIKLTTEAIFN